MRRLFIFTVLMFTIVLVAACGQMPRQSEDGQQNQSADRATDQLNNDSIEDTESDHEPVNSPLAEKQEEVHVELINKEGEVIGSAFIHEQDNGVTIDVEARDLPPGAHGFHIHEKGVCEKPSFESAGGHFNPTHKEHGFENPKGPHAGDILNMEVGEDGKVQETFKAENVTLKKNVENSLFHKGGTSLIIHADPDDYISQPAGNSGERIACGVISK